MASKTYFLFAGNPGSGKSTICNGCVQRAVFRSGMSFATGLTTKFQVHSHENGQVFIDTPGLFDVKTRDQVAKEITQALKMEGEYKLVFVITLEAARVRPEDALAMRLILDALPSNVNYGVIFNKVTPRIHEALLDPQRFAAIWNELGYGIRPTMFFHVYPLDAGLVDVDNKVPVPRAELTEWLDALPATYIKAADVKDVQVSEYGKMLDHLEAALNELRTDISKREAEHIRQVAALEEQIQAIKKANKGSGGFFKALGQLGKKIVEQVAPHLAKAVVGLIL